MCERGERKIGTVFFREINGWRIVKVPLILNQDGDQWYGADTGVGWVETAVFKRGYTASPELRQDLENCGCKTIIDDAFTLELTERKE